MPMPDNIRKERLSLAYIRAVGASAGFEVTESKVDLDSVDGQLAGFDGKKPRIEFQAKATTADAVSEKVVSFPLIIKNYDELRAKTVVPRLLVVVVIPPHEKEWLTHSESELIVRHCGYWLNLEGAADTQNTASVTVRIPRAQVFDVDHLRQLMIRAEKGTSL